MCWNRFRWSITNFCRMLINNIYVICAFWFLRGVGCLKVNGQLVKSPFYIPYSSVCLVFVCWWCFHFLSVSQSLSILQFSPNYPCECVFGKVKRFISRNWLYHPSCIIVHTSMSMSTQGVQPPGDRGDVAEVAKEKLWFHNWLQQKKLLHLVWRQIYSW